MRFEEALFWYSRSSSTDTQAAAVAVWMVVLDLQVEEKAKKATLILWLFSTLKYQINVQVRFEAIWGRFRGHLKPI